MKQPLVNFATPVLSLPRPAKRLVALLVDVVSCILALWLAYYLRTGVLVDLSGTALWAVMASIVIAIPIFIMFGLYRAIFRYSGWPALSAVVQAMGIYGLLYAAIFTVIGVKDIPRTIGIIQPILLFLFLSASRVLVRICLGNQYLSVLQGASRPKALVYGAGSTGRQLVDALANNHEIQIVGFLDDDEQLHGQVLNGQPIYSPTNLKALADKLTISDVLFAIPSLSRRRRNEILDQIQAAHLAVRVLPSVVDLAQGKVSISDLRELDIDDLLGREPVRPNHELLAKNIFSKIVMVTGAGGSIGSELCRQIFAMKPSTLLLIEQSEFALYLIQQELEKNSATCEIELVPLLASVQDAERMRAIISSWHPQTIYHAAAYKHVPLVEHNPTEGIKNNVFGTLHTAQAAMAYNVPSFILISTDKAVRPTSIMGASKRLAEMVLQALAAISPDTTFSMVRFGNVLDSSGSVVPKFRQQIQEGGPVTLTHPEVIRYFMTIPEAAQLVIQAGAMAKGGDVFVLDMGQPVKILDLAKRMIELSGLKVKDEQTPDGDIEIEIIGLRPGEKLYEELLIGNNPTPTSHLWIMKAQEEFIPWVILGDRLKALEAALKLNDSKLILEIIKELVCGYTPSSSGAEFWGAEF